ncbi:hypothetical protein DFH09DRAFT_1372384 [Mycena vulgaris]|nr:hypothetical protein DFH09DRAFT_1372384 [Mycena vulgaris]
MPEISADRLSHRHALTIRFGPLPQFGRPPFAPRRASAPFASPSIDPERPAVRTNNAIRFAHTPRMRVCKLAAGAYGDRPLSRMCVFRRYLSLSIRSLPSLANARLVLLRHRSVRSVESEGLPFHHKPRAAASAGGDTNLPACRATTPPHSLCPRIPYSPRTPSSLVPASLPAAAARLPPRMPPSLERERPPSPLHPPPFATTPAAPSPPRRSTRCAPLAESFAGASPAPASLDVAPANTTAHLYRYKPNYLFPTLWRILGVTGREAAPRACLNRHRTAGFEVRARGGVLRNDERRMRADSSVRGEELRLGVASYE